MSDGNGDKSQETIEITINGQKIETEPGRLVIDIAEEMGVFVPRFCYHPGMKSVAVCRMCLVKVEGMPKLVPSCATPATDGMVVDTVEDGAADAQKDMLEFLLINHPLDCPVCDRAGECPLQDQTYRHGPGSSRYTEEKRTFEKPLEISELVVLDRERCVLCWRCVRFSDEIAGDRLIQLVDRGDGTQILNFEGDPFDSYFSGNTIQICPVGALTAKPYRFVSRPWDLETAPSVCSYCSVGCPITNESRRGTLVRCQALPNEQVNDFWNCDKGRFGYHYVSSEDRLETPLVRGESDEFTSVGWGEAVTRIAQELEDKTNVGVIAGGHLTTEDAFAISKLAKKTIGTRDVDSRLQDAGAPYEMLLGSGNVAGSTATIDDLRAADTIVWAGPDPKETLPVLYLHLHAAAKDGDTRLISVSSRRTSLDGLGAESVRVAPGDEAAAIGQLAGTIQGKTVVCWGPSSPGRDESGLLRALLELADETDARMLICPPHAGSQGMIDMGVHPALDPGYALAAEAGRDTRAILEAAASGELDALLLFGADPVSDFPDRDLARRALESDTFIAVVELFPTESALLADVVLPSTAYAEREGTFTNLERRLQKLEALTAPPGTAREPWRACMAIARALGDDWGWDSFADVWKDICAEVPTHCDLVVGRLSQEAMLPAPYSSTGYAPENTMNPLQIAGPGGQYPKGHRQGAPFQTGQNWPLSWELRAFEAKQRPGIIPPPRATPDATPSSEQGGAPKEASAGGAASSGASEDRDEGASARAAADGTATFTLLSGRFIYDEGTMVSRTSHLRNMQKRPFVEINDEDAKALGIADGDEVVVSGAGTDVTLPAVVNGIAKGCVFIPYDQMDLRANTLMSGVDPTVSIARSGD